ncbi:hypothetical protein I6F15_30855 [Bradyrhizobium sp. BRP14]|nr:hypothetical protein [Bradyrhizobium sp. BRP14]
MFYQIMTDQNTWIWADRIFKLGFLIALFVWWQNAKLSREAAALAAYRKYLQLSIANPKLATYSSFSKNFDSNRFVDIRKSRNEDVDRYEWFLSYLLNTCEEIVENVSSKGEWHLALTNQLNYHAPALEILWPKWRATYGRKMKQLGDSVIKTPTATSAQ